MSAEALRDRAPRPLRVAGEHVQVRVRESARARTARVLVGPERPLEIIVPAGTSDARVDEMLASRHGWIERKTAASRKAAARPARLGLDRPGVVWLAGTPLLVEVLNGSAAPARLCDGRLGVGAEARPGAIGRWYRNEARRRIRATAAEEASRLGLSYRSVSVRDPRTRWGSCSRLGNLSFSWRLMLAPDEVLRYVVVHELCHLEIPSHNRAFWRMLEVAQPGWRDPADWLTEHGAELRNYRVVIPVVGSLREPT
jgi:predicted metal-dependent hydrolase